MGMFGNAVKSGIKQNIMPGDQMRVPSYPTGGGGLFGSGKGANALGMISAVLADIGGGNGPDMVLKLAAAKQEAAQKAQKQAAMQQMFGLFGGSAQTGGAGGPNLRDPRVAQMLLQAEAMGVDVGTALELMKAQQIKGGFAPNGQFVDELDASNVGKNFSASEYINGFRVNPNDPNAPGFLPKLPDATIPDGRGGVIPLAGAAEAVARQEGMVAGAKAGATAPYEFITAEGPQGQRITTNKTNALGQGGMIVGQAPAARIAAESAARGDADRAQAAQDRAAGASRQLAALDTMETLLPDVIAGFGADKRLEVNRALALAGNEEAKRKVAATETFINQGRVLVADIIKSFGTNPTEGERKFAERMSGADAQLNPETLKEGIRLQRARINRDLAAAGRGPGSGGGGRALPKVGDTVGGYSYKGGDPRSPSSWQKVGN